MRLFSLFVSWAFAFPLFLLSLGSVAAQTVGLPHVFESGAPAYAADVNENFAYVAPKNVIFVNRASGGTAADNGAALRAALQTANLTALNGAPSSTNRYLVKIGPGVYDVGTTALLMQHYVDVEGSGLATIIRGQATGDGVVRAASHCELRSLTVEASSTSSGYALRSHLTQMRVRNVDLVLTSAGATGAGVWAESGSTLTLDNVRITVRGGNTAAVGIYATGGTVQATHVSVLVELNTPYAVGISTSSSGSFVGSVVDIKVLNSGTGSSESWGVSVEGASTAVTLDHAAVQASGPVAYTAPLRATAASQTLTVRSSVLQNLSGESFLQNTAATVRIGTTQLSHSSWTGSGTVKCVYVYDANFDSTTCVNLI